MMFLQVNVIMLSIAMYVMCRHATSPAASWKTKDMTKLDTARFVSIFEQFLELCKAGSYLELMT
jgi:hypothetical protein